MTQVVPSTGTGTGFSPVPTNQPFAAGPPREGPKSALVSVTIPAGVLSQSVGVPLSQIGFSQVQSALVDNQAGNVGVKANIGGQNNVTFSVAPNTAQMMPVYSASGTLYITLTLPSIQPTNQIINIQLFNTEELPYAYQSSVNVSGNMNINSISGSVNATITNATLSVNGAVAISGGNLSINNGEFGIQAMPTGGATATFFAAMTNTPVNIKGAAAGTFKGFTCVNPNASIVYLQMFDVVGAGLVTLGTTPPTLVIPIAASIVTTPTLPPEGIAFANGIIGAITTTPTGGAAPASTVPITFWSA